MNTIDATLAEFARRLTEPRILRHGPPSATAADWPRATPTEAGIAPELPRRLAEAERTGRLPNLHGLVVVRGGKLVLEHYGAGPDFSWGKSYGEVSFGPDTRHDLRSVTKSIVALLYGIALADGQVPEPEAPLLAQFPEYRDLAADPRRARLTVAHALTMTLGLAWDEGRPYGRLDNDEIGMELAPDRYRYLLERPVVEPPGHRWLYCGGASALIGRLVADGAGVSLSEYAAARLFGPLGIAGFEWLAGDDAVASAASGLRLTPRDLARIGQVVLAGGVWGGEQVVPAGWLPAMLRPQATTDWGDEYGYQWYLGGTGAHRCAYGIGNGGQLLNVYPQLDMVAAITAGAYDGDPGPLLSTLLDEVLLPCVRP